MKNDVQFGLRNKLFLLVVVAFSLLLAAIVWQIRNQAQTVSNKAIDESLARSQIILDTKMASRFDSIREVARNLSKDGRILPLVFEKQSLTLQDLAIEFKTSLDFNSLFFIDADGVVLARSDRPEAGPAPAL